MNQINLTPAITAVRARLNRSHTAGRCWLTTDDLAAIARDAVIAAVPHLREQLAQQIEGLIDAIEVPEEWVEAIDAYRDAAAIVRGEVTSR